MTPEQHYQHGLDLLAQAEAASDPVSGQKIAVTALANLAAAAFGADLRAKALLTKPAEVGDRVAIVLPAIVAGRQPRRVVGVVTEVGADGLVAAAFDQGDTTPLVITAPSEYYVVVQVAGRAAPATAPLTTNT